MKKIACLFLCVVFCICLWGCAATKPQKGDDALQETQKNTLPDGEYRLMFYEDQIYEINGVEYADVEQLEFVELSDSYVRSLQVGDVINFPEYGLRNIVVKNNQITKSGSTEEIHCFNGEDEGGWMLYRTSEGNWRIIVDGGWYVLTYVESRATLEFAADAQIVDKYYSMFDEDHREKYVDSVSDLFEAYGNQAQGDLEINVTISNGKVTKAVFHYAPVI